MILVVTACISTVILSAVREQPNALTTPRQHGAITYDVSDNGQYLTVVASHRFGATRNDECKHNNSDSRPRINSYYPRRYKVSIHNL